MNQNQRIIRSTRWLLQIETGHVYTYTPEIAKKSGMREITEDEKNLILAEQNDRKKTLAQRQGIIPRQASQIPEAIEEDEEDPGDVKRDNPFIDEVLKANQDIQTATTVTPEEIPLWNPQADPEVAKINSMSSKNQVEGYILEKYGESVANENELPRMKQDAIEIIRKNRLS